MINKIEEKITKKAEANLKRRLNSLFERIRHFVKKEAPFLTGEDKEKCKEELESFETLLFDFLKEQYIQEEIKGIEKWIEKNLKVNEDYDEDEDEPDEDEDEDEDLSDRDDTDDDDEDDDDEDEDEPDKLGGGGVKEHVH